MDRMDRNNKRVSNKLKRIPVLQKKIALDDASRVVSHKNKRLPILVRQSLIEILAFRDCLKLFLRFYIFTFSGFRLRPRRSCR